ncbi:sulfite exporter TauE/SafE family protein [Silvimonas sp.]|uniref:sulfite exporter TauE/SafE family protein n=1 Tax=Silvimonas sp. TaxID=2650811 RepID=UPI00283CD879|nr:sulfite exporter TauE/SafE family protein [Silvimonas sp.]MDR3428951.1 sulfite exporter TauE/SafE family protein [Silvimonas sp.]
MILVLLLGALVGAVLGLTGAGGGILAVPALVAGLGWTVQQAAPVALIAVAAGAATGAVEGFRQGLVRYRAGLLMAALGVPLTGVGAWLAHRIPTDWLTGLFGITMLIVAFRGLHRASQAPEDSRLLPRCSVNPATGRLVWTPASVAVVGGIGMVTGLLTGLLGVGGGFVIVPALRRFTSLSMHAIVATSLFVIALTGCGGVLTAQWHGTVLPPAVTWPFLGAVVSGMIAGRLLAQHLPGAQIQRGFALLVLLIGLSMIAKAL